MTVAILSSLPKSTTRRPFRRSLVLAAMVAFQIVLVIVEAQPRKSSDIEERGIEWDPDQIEISQSTGQRFQWVG